MGFSLSLENDLKHKVEYFAVPDIPKEESVVQEIHKAIIWQKISKLFPL